MIVILLTFSPPCYDIVFKTLLSFVTLLVKNNIIYKFNPTCVAMLLKRQQQLNFTGNIPSSNILPRVDTLRIQADKATNIYVILLKWHFGSRQNKSPSTCIFCITNGDRKYWLFFISLTSNMFFKNTLVKLMIYCLEIFNNPVKIKFNQCWNSSDLPWKQYLLFFTWTFFVCTDLILTSNNYNLWV